MRKNFLTYCLTLLAAVCLCTTAGAATAAQGDVAVAPTPSRGETMSGTLVQGIESLTVGKLNVSAQATEAAQRKAPAKRVAVSSTQSLAGSYVSTYSSLLTSNDATLGTSTTITALGTDSITVTNFGESGISLKAAVDLATGTVTIPNQVVLTHSTYGDCDIATCLTTGKPDRSTPITGVINEDGSITINGWWAVFVKSGSKADGILVAGYNGLVDKANATMVTTVVDTTTVYNWNVVVKQTAKNLVTVKNLGNHGQTVELLINSDSTISISQQIVWYGGSTYGTFYVLGADWTTGKTSTPLVGKVNGKTITWGQWVMYSTTRYYTGKYDATTITTDFDITVPQLTVTEWAGSGTEADPWQIKTLDDLILLAEKVNSNTDYNGGYNNTVARTYMNKYFKVMNDIDMSGYRFTPIGNSYYQRFAATLDGDGHTLSNLDVSTGGKGYAALIGNGDTISVIKNLTLKDVTVKSSYYYTAGVAGYTYGKIENCHVTGDISGYVSSAGIVGVGNNVNNCSFDGTVTGTGGVVGGIAGQVYGTLSNSNARGTLTASSSYSSYTAGGVIATLYGYNTEAVVENCYFTGDVMANSTAGFYAGGVVGNNYCGKVDRCFAAANVYTMGSSSVAGGVVGVLAGDLSNSYATGYVGCVSSRMSGGVTGLVRNYVHAKATGNDTLQSSVKNCYFAGRLAAEDYLYDPETEVRETLGTINTGATPTVENVYFDKQMVDYTSKQYGVLTSELTSASGPTGFDASAWTYAEGYYPRIKGLEDVPAAQLSASVLELDPAFPDNVNYVSVAAKLHLLGGTKAYAYVGGKLTSAGHHVTISGDQVTLNGTFGADTLVFYNPSATYVTPRFFILQVAPKYFDGLGKESDPFLIKTKADLMKLGELTTDVRQLFKDVYFLQTADIDMESDSTFLCISSPLTNYTDVRFSGTYDGGGHAIHNLYVNYITWTKKPTSREAFDGTPNTKGERTQIYRGLFGQLAASGVVKNLTIASDCYYDLWGYAGAIVGYNYGTVDNCKNFADLYSYSSTVGGIVGYNNPGGVISNCYNAGNIYDGYITAGGIVGTNTGTIENCQNVGNVTVKSISKFQTSTSKLRFAGGIAGGMNGGVMRNVVNAGNVSAWSMAAGIVASYSGTSVHDGNNDITGAVSYGTVLCPDDLNKGAIGANGYNPAAETKAVFYDKQSLGVAATAGDAQPGVTACTTAQLTSGKALEGLSTDVFTFAEGQYPVITKFASEPLVQAAAKIVLTLGDTTETVRHIVSNATLSQSQGTTWKLAQGTQFGISGSTLTVPTVTATVQDTLTATLDGFTRPIPLSATTANPLAGSGTEADPFQLKTTDDWNNLAAYIAEAANSLSGQYVKVMNDIDFTGVTFKPLAYDAVTPFGGILVGDNRTIKGIKYTTTATYQGAICTLGVGGEVRDLTLQGAITSAKSYTGGFVGNLKGALVGCTNDIAVTATAADAAGFAGNVTGTGSFTRCTNKAAITSSKAFVAGFAGLAATKVSFTDCVNEGTITGTGSKVNGASGFVASGQGTIFTHCANKGEIKAEGVRYVGGLQGYSTKTDTLVLIGCYNTATVSGRSSVGGIVGGQLTSSSAAHTPVYADSCYNTGDITSSASDYYGTSGLFAVIAPKSQIYNCYNTGSVVVSEAGIYTGAIWGYCNNGSTADAGLTVRNCYNTGGVIGVNYGSGIGGYIPNYAVVDSCWNTGEISAKFGASGIGNIMGDDLYITNCWNAGNISTTAQGAGGINGYGSKRAHVSNCFNTGDITGASNAGGLGGQSQAIYTNCYNRGTVKADLAAGGLVGQPSYNSTYTVYSTSFINCYNAGRVIDNDTTVGNLVGKTASTNWKEGCNVITNTYYVTDFNGVYANDTVGGTPITVAELAKTTDLPGDWYFGDEFTFPVINGTENNDCAKAFAAAVVLNDGDTYDNVTRFVTLGQPDGVTWSDTGNLCDFWSNFAGTKEASVAEDVLVATCGEFQAKWPVKFNTTSGVSDVQTNKMILDRTYYNVAGARVSQPEAGQIYIEVTRYVDGTSVSNKIVK